MPSERSNGTSETTSRRGVLRAGVAALSAGVAVASAGCSEELPPLGGRVRFGRVDAPSPSGSPRAYREWLPAPSAFASPYVEGSYDAMFSTPGAMGSSAFGTPFTFPESLAAGQLDYFGIDYEDYDRVIWINEGITVVEVETDRSSVGSVLTDSGYEAGGSYRDYDLYERGDLPRAVAVGDSAIVYAADAAAEDVTLPIDARAGRVKQYHEVSDDHERITDAARASPMTWVVPDVYLQSNPEYRPSIWTMSYRFDDEAVYFVDHRLYPEDAGVTESAIEEEVAENGRAQRSFLVDAELEGRLSTIEMRGEAEKLFEDTEAGNDIPQVTWGLGRDADTGTVRIRHEVGDPIPADRLTVSVGGATDSTTQFTDQFDTVEPGDQLAVRSDALDGDHPEHVSVVFEFAGGSQVRLLGYDFDSP